MYLLYQGLLKYKLKILIFSKLKELIIVNKIGYVS